MCVCLCVFVCVCVCVCVCVYYATCMCGDVLSRVNTATSECLTLLVPCTKQEEKALAP
jgi:hypothetical protein